MLTGFSRNELQDRSVKKPYGPADVSGRKLFSKKERVYTDYMTFLFVSVPDAAPLIHEVTTTNPKECLLSWSPIPAEHHRGVLLGYRIVYTTENDASNSSNITVGVSEYRGIPVNGLRHYTKYLLRVAGFTSKGDGNYSTVEDCQTLESG